MTDIHLHIGQRLRRRRRILNMRQYQLANALGVSHQHVAKWESAENRLNAAQLWEVAQALGVEITYFYEGLETQQAAA